MVEMVSISKKELEQLRSENAALKNTKLYKAVLKSHQELKQKRFTRKDLGF